MVSLPFPPAKDAFNAKLLLYKNRVWNEVWQALASMKGLRYLRVQLKVEKRHWQSLETEIEEAILHPIRSIKVPGQFDLILPLLVARLGLRCLVGCRGLMALFLEFVMTFATITIENAGN